jgi:hypothetical protein
MLPRLHLEVLILLREYQFVRHACDLSSNHQESLGHLLWQPSLFIPAQPYCAQRRPVTLVLVPAYRWARKKSEDIRFRETGRGATDSARLIRPFFT